MLKEIMILASGLIMISSCNAKNETIPINFSNGNEEFFNAMFADDQKFRTIEDYNLAIAHSWFKPMQVNEGTSIRSIEKCADMIAGDGILSEAQPNQFIYFQYRKATCHALNILASAKPSKKSFLPQKLVSKNSHTILPKEFIPIYSNSQATEINAMPENTRWSSGITLDRFEDVGINAGILYQSEQNQVLRELGRADFNNDGIEDALLYLRTKVNGGSHETNKIFLVTADEDGLVKTLSVFPED